MLYILFFLSGFSALVYEVTWVRKLSLIFGTDTIAVSAILAIFFTGLAIGSFIFRRIHANPLRTYALMELGIGGFAFMSPWLVSDSTFLGLFIPTVLMGGTLPVIAKTGASVGLLYGINTLGAAVGVLASGFYLIGAIGVNETIWLAAALSLGVGFVALYFGGYQIHFQRQTVDFGTKSELPARRLLLMAALFGFAGMALEVLWMRVAVMVMGGSTYAFSLVLLAFLAGIGLGSMVFGLFERRDPKTKRWLIVVAIIVGISVVLMPASFEQLPLLFLGIYEKTGQVFVRFQIWMFFVLFLLMAVPTIGMGMLFPIVVKLVRNESESVGAVYGANTIGGVVGSLSAVFLLPTVGLFQSVFFAGSIYLVIAVWSAASLGLRWAAGTVVMTLVVATVGLWYGTRDPLLLASGLYADPDTFVQVSKEQIIRSLKQSRILFSKDSLSTRVAVTESHDGTLSLLVNGKPDASTGDDMENQVLLGQLPLFLHPGAKDALVIGLGSGITLGSILTHPVQRVDVVEIDDVVPHAARFFDDYSHTALSDERVNLIIADGRHFLQKTDNLYDLISSEPSNPWLSGSSKLFTKEFFTLMKNRTKDDGIVIQWINMYAIDVTGLSSIIKAYLDVFPFVAAFGVPLSNDILLVGSQKELLFDLASLRQTYEIPSVKQDLQRIGVMDGTEVLARYYLDRPALSQIVAQTPPNTDDHPIVEFSAPYYLYIPVTRNPWRVVADNISPLKSVIGDGSDLGNVDKIRLVRLQARNALIDGNFALFVRFGSEALAMNPTSTMLKSNLARAYFEQGSRDFLDNKITQAIEYLTKSLEYKETPPAHVNLAQSYEEIGDMASAAQHYQRAITLDNTLELPHIRLGVLRLDAGDLNAAVDLFERALTINNKNAETHWNLGQLYLLRNDIEKARMHIQKVIRLDPENSDAREVLKQI